MSHVAQELTIASTAGQPWLRRLNALLKAIVSRIDLSHFPKSCCN
jgi:hypothetical protein